MIEDIGNLLTAQRLLVTREICYYRALLFGFSALTVALFLYAFYQALRGHALLRRSNDRLRKYGRGLEDMVSERVRELQASEASMRKLSLAVQQLVDERTAQPQQANLALVEGERFIRIAADNQPGARRQLS